MVVRLVEAATQSTTRGITPTESYEIQYDGKVVGYVNKGDTDYFATDENGGWISTWYSSSVEAANAGLNKLEEKGKL